MFHSGQTGQEQELWVPEISLASTNRGGLGYISITKGSSFSEKKYKFTFGMSAATLRMGAGMLFFFLTSRSNLNHVI